MQLKRREIRRLLSSLGVIVTATAIPALGFAADITVDTTDDSFGDGSTCSLRAAIESANSDSAVDGCVTGDGADKIILSSGETYELTITGDTGQDNTEADLWIDSEVDIETSDTDRATINANQISRVFTLSGNGLATFSNLAITGGLVEPGHGGGILNDGQLTLENSVVHENTAQGSNGNLEPGGFGGGIYNSGLLDLIDTTVWGNSALGGHGQDRVSGRGSGGGGGAGLGGGIFSSGDLDLSNAYLYSNGAAGGNGGHANGCATGAVGDGGNGGGNGGAGGVGNSGDGDAGLFGGGGGGGGSDLGDGGDGGFGGGGGGAGAQSFGGNNSNFGSGGYGAGDGGTARSSCGSGGGGGAGIGGALFNDEGSVVIDATTRILFNEVSPGAQGGGHFAGSNGQPGEAIASAFFSRNGTFDCNFDFEAGNLEGSFQDNLNCISTTDTFTTVTIPEGGDFCPDGGVRLFEYEDLGNGFIDIKGDDVCNGSDGQDGLTPVIQTTEITPGDSDCPEGGVLVEVGYDDGSGTGTADDDVLEDAEIHTTTSICNGASGEDGADGADGADGEDGDSAAALLIRTTNLDELDEDSEFYGVCEAGGSLFESGRDLDGDGALSDEEVESSTYVCNGAAGRDGADDSGCSSTGGKAPASMLGLLGLFGVALIRRRRRNEG
ncbi:MAG: DUF7151 family protein [Myxococcota bacterium]